MPGIDEIRKNIERELDLFEIKFRESMKSSTPLLNAIMRYIIKRKGKQIRPMFVFLSAKTCMPAGQEEKEIPEATYRGAALIELLHTATLVHDDVVDDSLERRGFFSVNALWKNKIAVLVGDYLLAKGLLLSVDNNDFEILRIVSNAVREMSEGELLQIEKTRRLNIKEEIYFEIIRQKTASLISSACAVGAYSSGAEKTIVENMKLFGEKIGIAFQIKDDLMDFGGDDIGKPHGIDIQEKKLTLPLIYALNNSSYAERRRLINTIKNHNHNFSKVKEVIAFVNKSGGIEYAKEKMNHFKEDALQILQKLPQNTSKRALVDLVNFTTERIK